MEGTTVPVLTSYDQLYDNDTSGTSLAEEGRTANFLSPEDPQAEVWRPSPSSIDSHTTEGASAPRRPQPKTYSSHFTVAKKHSDTTYASSPSSYGPDLFSEPGSYSRVDSELGSTVDEDGDDETSVGGYRRRRGRGKGRRHNNINEFGEIFTTGEMDDDDELLQAGVSAGLATLPVAHNNACVPGQQPAVASSSSSDPAPFDASNINVAGTYYFDGHWEDSGHSRVDANGHACSPMDATDDWTLHTRSPTPATATPAQVTHPSAIESFHAERTEPGSLGEYVSALTGSGGANNLTSSFSVAVEAEPPSHPSRSSSLPVVSVAPAQSEEDILVPNSPALSSPSLGSLTYTEHHGQRLELPQHPHPTILLNSDVSDHSKSQSDQTEGP
eukprot:CAMPEP_0175158954 /NCGR_PEP_ID=MMETSP0087-20121206/23124_1 /TAXON_ID=136419 /ORGANISM="Unknown Unknown, Strain D1" /LENGTH=385 /DNA_ID=CAMNT_0016446891 /DNA_START=80 /DNA_END=1237 /DNA_ORIENTATION=+